MRWIVKKVVEFIIDALLKSDKLDDLLEKVAKKIVVQGNASEVMTRAKTLGEKTMASDDIDSTMEIANMIISRGSHIEMSDISGGSEEVTEADESREGVMDILKNIGD